MQYQNQIFKEQQNDTISICCHYCGDFLCVAVETPCKHYFCEECIYECLNFVDQCPVCKQRLRNYPLCNNIILDNITNQYIVNNYPQELENYKLRVSKYRQFKQKSRIGVFRQQMIVDVLDSNHVWVKGKVRSIFYRAETNDPILIEVERSGRIVELLPNSNRLAVLGTYSARKDLPFYRGGKILIMRDKQYFQLASPKRNE